MLSRLQIWEQRWKEDVSTVHVTGGLVPMKWSFPLSGSASSLLTAVCIAVIWGSGSSQGPRQSWKLRRMQRVQDGRGYRQCKMETTSSRQQQGSSAGNPLQWWKKETLWRCCWKAGCVEELCWVREVLQRVGPAWVLSCQTRAGTLSRPTVHVQWLHSPRAHPAWGRAFCGSSAFKL